MLFGSTPYVFAVTFEANCDIEKDVGEDREIVNLFTAREFDDEIIDALVELEYASLLAENAWKILYQVIHAFAELTAEKSYLICRLLDEMLRFYLNIAVVFHRTS